MVRWLTCNIPAGCSTSAASVGSSCRGTTSSFRFAGNAVFQFEAFWASAVRIGMTWSGGSAVLGWWGGVGVGGRGEIDADVDGEKEEGERRSAVHMPGCRPR